LRKDRIDANYRRRRSARGAIACAGILCRPVMPGSRIIAALLAASGRKAAEYEDGRRRCQFALSQVRAPVRALGALNINPNCGVLPPPPLRFRAHL